MNNHIKVSIITPSYNQGQFIEATILSVLNQTYKNIEYIIVDGGSTDNTPEIIDKYRDKIDIVISEKDKGQSDAINKGFQLATGTLSGWINSDDILYPDCVEKIVNLHRQHPDGSIYYPSSLDFIDKAGTLLYRQTHKITDKNYLLNVNYKIFQQGSFYNAVYLKKVGYLDENIYYCMDLDLWLRLLDYGNIYYYEGDALSAFRVWEDTKTSLAGMLFLKDMKKTINKYGAKKISKANLRLYYILFRMYGGRIKRFLHLK
jgi:glycosyltransferase involved in cell wall biosynthesis